MRTVFLGSAPFATPSLRALVASERHRPVCVVTPPDRAAGRGREVRESPVARLAAEAGIDCLRPDSARAPEFLDAVRAREPDVCLVVSYGELLTQEFLDIPRVAPLNVHGSLLPRHRGASPVQAAILAGDATTGVSVQRVVLALDAGDVLLERETPIGERETGGELFERLAELGAEAAVAALDRLESGDASFTPQDEALVTTCRKLRRADARIDWSRSAVELERLVRAMNPWPGAWTPWRKGASLLVHRAEVLAHVDAEPGRLAEADGRLVVGTGAGALELVEVQVSGKARLAAPEFLRGARLTTGEELPT